MKPTPPLVATTLAILTVLVTDPIVDAATCTFPIVDTGQELCYGHTVAISCPAPGETFYGQDAQCDGSQPDYTLSGDGRTVYDGNTGLTWIRKPDTDGDGDLDTYDQLTWSEFLACPDTLNAQSYGGYDDWRAPSLKELYSLIDFRGLDPSGPNPINLVPFIDTTYFDFVYGDESIGERLIDAQYWSTNQYVGTVFGGQIAIFGVNFADGRIKGYPRDIGPTGIAVHYARYVRGNPAYGTNDFVENGDGTITDSSTGLMWSQDDYGDGASSGPRSGMVWADALAWVQEKNAQNYLGYSDWRLPSAKEMQSIVDYTRAPDATGTAAIDPVFHITQITNEAGQVDYPWFWTGTTHARADGQGPNAAYICFGRALGYMFGSWLDVHGAGAQRSDRKDGDFSAYAYVSNGYYFLLAPQGDASRQYNYVRPVRDADSSTTVGNALPGTDTAPQLRSIPNPTQSGTDLVFTVSRPGPVTLAVYDAAGRRVRTVVRERVTSSEQRVRWDGTGADDRAVPAGVYFAQLTTETDARTVKMVVTK